MMFILLSQILDCLLCPKQLKRIVKAKVVKNVRFMLFIVLVNFTSDRIRRVAKGWNPHPHLNFSGGSNILFNLMIKLGGIITSNKDDIIAIRIVNVL